MKIDLRAMKSILRKIDAIGTVETMFNFRKNVLHIRCVDPVHISLLDMNLKIKNCTEKDFDFGVKLNSLMTRIISLPLGNKNKRDNPENQLNVQILKKKGKICGLKFQHPMLTFQKVSIDGLPSSIVNYPEGILELDAVATINRYQLQLFLKIAGQETDHISFIVERKPERFIAQFKSNEEETVFTNLTYTLGGIEGLKLEFLNNKVQEIKSLFSVDYLINIAKLINAPTIKIGLKSDAPIVVWWEEEDLLSGTYMVAPKIKSD